jgi:hypothetical protein
MASLLVAVEHLVLASGLIPPVFSLMALIIGGGWLLVLAARMAFLNRLRQIPLAALGLLMAAVLPVAWNWPMRLVVAMYDRDLRECLRSGEPGRFGPINVIEVDQKRDLLVTRADEKGDTGLWLAPGSRRGLFFGAGDDVTDDWTFAQED